MTATLLDEMMTECLRNCTECHNVCLQTAVDNEVAGQIKAEDLKLLINCAEICRSSADFLNTNSPYHRDVCRTCAEICDACAKMCERSAIPVMKSCAPICRTCAESCRRMAGMT
jgi:hypothetical protein